MSVSKAKQGSVAGVAGGYAPLDSGLLVPAAYRMAIGTSALETTEGDYGWRTDAKEWRVYDGQRERAVSKVGWTPSSYPLVYSPNVAMSTSLSLPADGGTIAIPIVVVAHALMGHAAVKSNDTASARAWRWDLYVNRTNLDTVDADQTIDRVVTGGNEAFTASAASERFVGGSGQPIYVSPGLYWLVVQNTHATNTFAFGYTAATAGNVTNSEVAALTKTTSNPNGATLVLGDGTWTKRTGMYGAVLRHWVLGMDNVL